MVQDHFSTFLKKRSRIYYIKLHVTQTITLSPYQFRLLAPSSSFSPVFTTGGNDQLQGRDQTTDKTNQCPSLCTAHCFESSPCMCNAREHIPCSTPHTWRTDSTVRTINSFTISCIVLVGVNRLGGEDTCKIDISQWPIQIHCRYQVVEAWLIVKALEWWC